MLAPKRRVSYLFVSYQRGGSDTFSRIFYEIFVMFLSIFLTDKVLLFPYFDFIRCFITGSRLYIYMYIIPWHSFLGELVSFAVRIETYQTYQVSFLQLLAPVDYPLLDLLTNLVLKVPPCALPCHCHCQTLNLSQMLAECCSDCPAQQKSKSCCQYVPSHPHFLKFLSFKCNIVVINTKFKFTYT